MHCDGQIGERLYRKREWVGKVVSVRWNCDGRRAGKCERLVSARDDLVGTWRGWSSHAHRRQVQGRGSKTIRQAQPNFGPSEREMYDLPQASIAEIFCI